MANLCGSRGMQLLLLSVGLCTIALPAAAAKGPKKLEFYMYIAVQNNSFLDNPSAPQFTAVQSAQPLQAQPNSFGIIHTFDNPLTIAPSLNSTNLGHVQGWYGDVGQNLLTLFLVQTFTYDDGKHNGTFSLLGVDVATDALKLAPIVGGTGDFAYARGVAQQSLLSTANINSETVSWFHFVIHFKY